MVAQPGHESLGFPMAERRLGIQALPFQTAAAQACHLGGGAGLIEKDEPMRLLAHARLTLGAPVLAGLAHVGASLLAGPQRFF